MIRSLLFLFILGFVLQVHAQDGESCRFPVDPTLEIPEEFGTYDAIVFLDSTNVSVTPLGSGTFSISRKIGIQTSRGALANRVIKYEYDPLTAFAEFARVTITRADGSIESIDIRTACDYAAPARAIYWGAREIMIEVGLLEPGDVIDYEISKKGFTYALLSSADDESRFIPPMRGHFYDIVPFWVDYPTIRKVHKVSIPLEKEMQFEFYHGECASSMHYEDGKKAYTFAMNNISPFQREPNMVDLFDAAPKLFMSSTEKWQDKSLWFHKVNEDYGSFDPLPEAQKKVDEIIKGKNTEMEKIAALTHWVADNIRYSGISMGEGEGFTLHNTQMNFTDRCGVCKDIAGTLISFLRMAGFEAYPVMTMAGSRVEKIPADHFNHCVAVVKLSGGTYMPLDPTWVPFCRELWSSAEQQQHYLSGVPEGSDICLTPVSAPENHYFRINAKNKIDEKGKLTGTFTVTAEGQSDSQIRRMFTLGWQSQWKDLLESQLLAVSPQAKLIGVDYGKDPKDYQAGPISITFHYEIPDYALVGSNEMLFKPLVMQDIYANARSYMRINTSAEKKKYGFKDSCSRLVELHEEIELPKGFTCTTADKTEVFYSDAADFEGSVKSNGNKIVFDQKLELRKRVYEASDWDGYRTAVNMHKDNNSYFTVIR